MNYEDMLAAALANHQRMQDEDPDWPQYDEIDKKRCLCSTLLLTDKEIEAGKCRECQEYETELDIELKYANILEH